MFKRSLRLRLILAFSVMVSLILVVGLVSYKTQAEVRDEVRNLGSVQALDLDRVDLQEVGLEFHGYWNPAGRFVADDIEVIPPRRPQLRGAIQAIDQAQRTLTVYGTTVWVTADTRNEDAPGQPIRFDELQVGQRVEVSCEVEKGNWRARELQARDVKSSDKIKGVVTALTGSDTTGSRLLLHGIEIVFEPKASSSAFSALSHIEQATQLVLALQTCRSRADQLVRAATHARGQTSGIPAVLAASQALRAASAAVRGILDRAYSPGGRTPKIPIRALRHSLDVLRERHHKLREHVERVARLADDDPAGAAEYLVDTLDPFLAEDFMPAIHAYLSMGGDELGDRLRDLVARTETTTRVATVASVVAVIVAFFLGLMVWRSIQRPIQSLHDAAVKLGKGHLDTRIEVRSHDEIGVLAEAFNTMAGELSATTVSMASLERVFDSMAAALILFDAHGRILNVNRATEAMLGIERDLLTGRTFDAVCHVEDDQDVNQPLDQQLGSRIESVEREFVRQDGTRIPVSLSGASLGAAEGSPQGYVCVAQDLTNRKRIEATIRNSLAEKELLLHELHHRVKNNIQVISSLLAMQTSDGDPEVTRRLADSQNRIRTIGLIHELLYRSPELAHIDIQDYLQVLAEQLLHSYGASETVALSVEVADVELDLDQSLAVGLIVNELITNSLKHAFPEGGGGEIRIALAPSADGTSTLTVSDDGCGADGARKSDEQTLGTSLVATLARQLNGSVDVHHNGGTATRIVFGGDRNSGRVAS